MLYPKNADAELKPELFQHPGSEYRGTPFWAWNCALEKDELLRQIDIFKAMGLGGAHMHVRTGLTTPYLSDEHMDLIRACVAKFKREGMLAWLYDEDRWPSGAAGGLVTKDARYRRRSLRFSPELGSDGGTLLACYDVCLDERRCLASARRIRPEESAAGWKWYAYLEVDRPTPWFNNQTYVNTLDKAAIDRFVEITHERYWRAIGDEFGGAVPAIFSDEPQFTWKQCLGFADERRDVALPWSDDVPDTFRDAYGEDLLERLPELFWELPDGRVSSVRYHYHDHIAERFAAAFADTCGQWCAKHNLMLTGHLMDEPTLQSQTAALGEAMRSYRGFQLPGIDMLCGKMEFTTAKQAQSAARQYGRPGVLSELYGVTGWGFDFRGHKFHGDWQAALGVTVRVHHLTHVSMKGEAKRDYPASIGYQSPWWQDYAFVEDHFARVNTALTRGVPVARVGIVHPVESYWLHWGPREQTQEIRAEMDQRFQNLTEWLVSGGIDFDFLCESLLPTLCESGEAPLRVGEMRYDVVVVPGCETLRSTTIERLAAFQKSGGLLIFLGGAPALADAVPDPRGKALWDAALRIEFRKDHLFHALEPVRMLDIRNENGSRTDNLTHQLRRDGDGYWLFIAHSRLPYNKDIPTAQNVSISVRGQYTVRVFDTQTGDVRFAACAVKDGWTVVPATLYGCDSLLLRLDQSAAAAPAKQTEFTAARTLAVAQTVEYQLEEPNVLLLDKAEYALDDGAYHPEEEILRADNAMREALGWPTRQNRIAQPWTIAPEKPAHTVRLRFRVCSAVDVPGIRLALEDADAAEIIWDGERIAAEPNGWFTDHTIQTVPLGELRRGEHVLEIGWPFGRRTHLEWCYLLGDFGVELQGEHRRIIARPPKIGFDDLTRQGFPYYGGSISYQIPLETQGAALRVTVPHYEGAAVKAFLDGRFGGYIAYPPYAVVLEAGKPGKRLLTLTLLGNRNNAFGPLHLADDRETWIGPDAWRSQGACWTESYRLTPFGIRTAPVVAEGETRRG